MSDLGALSSEEVANGRFTHLLVPLGSCEQHGSHLPLDTDTRVAAAIAVGVSTVRPSVAHAPPLAYGASGEHQGFPGVLSIGQAALEHLLVELSRCLGPEFRGLMFLSWHGGNRDAVQRAVDTITAEGRYALGLFPSVPGDAHAGRTETSLMLAIAPELVRLEKARPGNRQPIADLMPAMRRLGLRSVSPSGVLGDPAGASVEEGRRLLATLINQAVAEIDQWLEGA